MPTPTEQFIHILQSLKPGDLALLRRHIGQPLDSSVHGFDLFTGVWWPLRARYPTAPRREVAWLVAKLHAFRPLPHASGATLARQLGRLSPRNDQTLQRFDALLILPLSQIEPGLQWALTVVGDSGRNLDWVRLTDELSAWEREATRLKWSNEFLGITV